MAAQDPNANVADQENRNDQAAAAAALPVPGHEVSTTYRNNPAITIDGYTYVKKSTVKGVTYWRCAKCHKGCTARGKPEEGSTDLLLTYATHNHDADAAKQLVLAVRKQATERKQTGAAAIVDEAMLALPNDVALAVDRANLLRVANRAKRLDGSRQLNRPLADVVFPGAFTKTATGENFLLCDSRQHEPGASVIFIFASPTGLEQLRLRDHWSADGTFWCPPRLFDSLYTIHANTARRPSRPHFELAAINAIKDVFPDSLIRLCLFHFAQALWRKLLELGLVNLYRTVPKARILLRCFGALATALVEDISNAVDEVVEALRVLLEETHEVPEAYRQALLGFEDYFDNTYVQRFNAAGQLVAPRFRPVLWNCFMAILQKLHRTNNAVEGWHCEFNNTCDSAHPALDKFIVQLQNDEDKNRPRLARHEALPANPLRSRRLPAYVASDKHILAIARKYRTDYRLNNQILRYLKCMQYHLRQADFGEAEAGGANDNQPAAPAGDDGQNGDDEGIPLNESHPGLGNVNGGFEEEEEEDEQPLAAAIAAQPAVHIAFRGEAQSPVQLQAVPSQSQDGGMLPGGSQLGPGNGTAAIGTSRRQSKRAAAAAASAAWSFAGPTTSRPRFS